MKIKTLRDCPKKAYWGLLNLSDADCGTSKYYDAVIDELLSKGGFSNLENPAMVRQALEDGVPESAFIMKLEREANLSQLTERLVRMAAIMKQYGFTYVGGGHGYAYSYNNKNLTGSYRMVVDDINGVRYAVKLLYGKYEYSMKSGTKSHISTDTDLYVQQLATGMVPMVFSLLGNESLSGELKTSLDDIADPKKVFGRFVYYWDFSQEHTAAQAELDTLTALPITANAQENHTMCATCYYKDLCQIDNTDNYVEASSEAPVNQSEINWTPAQQKLIDSRSGETRVYAVAGSGKTTAIAERAICMLKEGINPSNVCLCTFTNKGVQEIKDKVARRAIADGMTDTQELDKLTILTLNALGMDIVRYHAEQCGTVRPELVDENEYVTIVAQIADQHPPVKGLNYSQPLLRMFNAEGAVYRLIRYIDLIRRSTADADIDNPRIVYACLSQDDSIKSILDDDGNVRTESMTTIMHIYNEVRHVLNEKGLMTYDDQIHKAVRILKEDDETLSFFRNRCQHLTVDEFQDTGLDQMEMVKLLYVPSPNSSLVVVGDASQSIMGFRGVGNENLVNFNKTYPHAVTIDMNANFRSTRQICDVAERVIKNNGTTVTLKTTSYGAQVKILRHPMKEDALRTAAEVVEDWLSAGKAPESIAVIARTRSELLAIRHLLDEAMIPTIISVSEYLKDDNQVIGAINLASYLTNHDNIKALAIWCRHSGDGMDAAVDPGDYLALQGAMLNEEFDSLDDRAKYDAFMEMLHRAYDSKTTNAMKTYFRYEESVTENNDMAKSFARAASYLKLIETTQSNAGAEREENTGEAVTLTTVHSAKGREWDNVIVLTSGFKQDSLKADAGGIVKISFPEEEIRTLFVAVTRAKKEEVIITNSYWLGALNNAKMVPYDVLKADGVRVTAPPKPKKAKKSK